MIHPRPSQHRVGPVALPSRPRPLAGAWAALAVAMLLVGAGCTVLGSEALPGRAGLACSRTADCGFGEVCVDGVDVCAPTYCERATDCGDPRVVSCCGGQCIRAGATCSAGCITDSDCGGGVCMLGRCVQPCQANDQCEAAETCVPLLGICLPNSIAGDRDLDLDPVDGDPDGDLDIPDFDFPTDGDFDWPFDFDPNEFDLPDNIPQPECETNADCDAGECLFGFCVDLGGPGGSRCQGDFDCGQGQRCLGGVCVGQPAGGPCQSNADCGGGVCLPFAGVCIGGTPTGTQPCITSRDCDSGYECIFGQCLPRVSGGGTGGDTTTPSTCRTAADCADNERCLMGVCTPRGGGGSGGGTAPATPPLLVPGGGLL